MTSTDVSPRAADRVAGLVGWVSRVLAWVSMSAMAFMMLLTVYDVARRNLGMQSVVGAIAYAEVALVVVAFFALGETQRRRDHVSVDALVKRLPARTYRVVMTVSHLAGIVVAALLAYASYDLMVESIQDGEYRLGLVRVALWPARLAVFSGFLAWSLQLAETMWGEWHDTPVRDDAVEPVT